MFGIFKKKPSAADFVEKLRPRYAEVFTIANTIDGRFSDLYQAGIFVSTIATSKILTFKKVNPPEFADEFNELWLNYLVGSYSVNGVSPDKDDVRLHMQSKFPVYRELFFGAINTKIPEKDRDTNQICLMSELFSNCTGKQLSEVPGSYFKVMSASGPLVNIGLTIFNDIHE